MVITIKKKHDNQELNKMLLSWEPQKSFCSKMFLGKVKWGEDALEYQKRVRDEWD